MEHRRQRSHRMHSIQWPGGKNHRGNFSPEKNKPLNLEAGSGYDLEDRIPGYVVNGPMVRIRKFPKNRVSCGTPSKMDLDLMVYKWG